MFVGPDEDDHDAGSPIRDMGHMAARWVLKNVYNQDKLTIQTIFKPEMVVRESAAAVS